MKLLKNHSGSYKASGVFDRPKTKAYRWNEGVIGMQAGGTRMIKIPPELGYGAKAVEDVIPPYAHMLFVIELLEAK
jgi:hypothetical protein